MELISPVLRLEFREFCVGLVLRQIDDIFQMAGFSAGTVPPERGISGARRTRVEEYYALIDWSSNEDAQKFLKVIGLVLSQSYISENQKILLRELCVQDGLIVDGHTIRFGSMRTGAKVKNLIFAADGPKPEIVLADSTTNEIKIVANEQHCLVYDRPILQHGLLWKDLVEWWREKNAMQNLASMKPENGLYQRLYRSLGNNEPEQMILNNYFVLFRHMLGDSLPALIPQVYLHYDPYTVRQLRGVKRLPRQRMDFLMLLPNEHRVVIEIDGKQHYALENGQASPQLYAEMMAEDRRLKLAGYEVYRFGGYEFIQPEKIRELIENFFSTLFERYSVTSGNSYSKTT